MKVQVCVRIDEKIIEGLKKRVEEISRNYSGVTLSSYINDVLKASLRPKESEKW